MKLNLAKHAFLTGGASGIGLALARALVARGASVTIADLDQAGLDDFVASDPDRTHGIFLDTRDRSAWPVAKAEAEARFGPVDVLINNACIGPDGIALADTTTQSFDRMIAIGLTSVFNGIHQFAADFRARGRGHILNTASFSGLTGLWPGIAAYTAAKFGVVGMSEVLRRELEPYDVGVSVLCPALVATNLWRTTVRLGSAAAEDGEGMKAHGMSAASVAEIALRGMERNDFFIVTEPDGRPIMAERARAIDDAFANLDLVSH